MSRRALLALAAALAPFAPACDYDAAYRTWCYKNDCDAFPASDGGVLYRCADCDSADDVCVVLDGQAACKKTCTGFAGGCEQGLDCKLVAAAYQISMVPACLPSGTSTELCGTSPLACAQGYTCAKDTLEVWRCLEMCTPFKRACDRPDMQCAYGAPGFPNEWGYCY